MDNRPLKALYKLVRRAVYGEHHYPRGRRAVVALKVTTIMVAGKQVSPEDILDMGEDSGRVVSLIRKGFCVPVITHSAHTADAIYSIREPERERLLNPDEREQQRRRYGALLARHHERRLARNQRALYRRFNQEVPEWVDAIASMDLPPVTAGSSDE